jgi:hypothetical protein
LHAFSDLDSCPQELLEKGKRVISYPKLDLFFRGFIKGEVNTFSHVEELYRFAFFQELFPFVLEEFLVGIFLQTWVNSEGFFVSPEKTIPTIKEVLKSDSNGTLWPNSARVKVNENTCSNGFITVYRGVIGDETEPSPKGFSWTLSEEVARFFGTKYHHKGYVGGNYGYIFKGEVKADDILLYSDYRNEKEVVVPYEKVKNIGLISKETRV